LRSVYLRFVRWLQAEPFGPSLSGLLFRMAGGPTLISLIALEHLVVRPTSAEEVSIINVVLFAVSVVVFNAAPRRVDERANSNSVRVSKKAAQALVGGQAAIAVVALVPLLFYDLLWIAVAAFILEVLAIAEIAHLAKMRPSDDGNRHRPTDQLKQDLGH